MQEILEKRRQPRVKTGRPSMKRGEEYGVCGWGANGFEAGFATGPHSMGLRAENMVRDEQILPPRVEFALLCFTPARLSVSLRQPDLLRVGTRRQDSQ
jgi:hypothetical protein